MDNSLLEKFVTSFRNKTTLRADIIAGITVGLVLIPQSLAYAQLAGLPPYYGLYASLLPPFIAAFFGSSSQLSTGPVAVLSLLTFAAVSPLSPVGSPEYVGYAILLAFFVRDFSIMYGFI
jgi:MFS superfamily sulfate permease-like transporter